MRIVVTYGRRPPYLPCGDHLVRAFRALGHEAWLLPVRDRPWWGTLAKRMPEPWKSRGAWQPQAWANQMLLRAARALRPDAVLDFDEDGALLSVETRQALRHRYGTVSGVWLVEGPFVRGIPPVTSTYDVLASTSQAAVAQLARAGVADARYLPPATDPTYFREGPAMAQRPYALGFIGAYSPKRAAFLGAVAEEELQLWGSEWDAQGPPQLRAALRSRQGVFGRAQARCYQRSRLQLHIQREHMMADAPDGARRGTGLNWRHVDVPACGGVMLTEWVEELPEAFELEREVVTFTTPEDLREKARYLLAHDGVASRIAQAGRRRVLHDHTWHQRAQQWVRWFAHVRAARV